jgi:hypothetical protein
MTRLGKFLQLPPADRQLLVTAVLTQAAIRLGLALLPYRRVRGLVDRLARTRLRRQPTPAVSPERIAWAVAAGSRLVPGTACLTQALAAQLLLERRGHPARVRVGISRTDGAELLAHAWLESNGRIVLGATDLTQYTPLSLDPLSPGGGEGQGEGEPSPTR